MILEVIGAIFGIAIAGALTRAEAAGMGLPLGGRR